MSRPPRDNNNKNTEKFVEDISSIMAIIQKGNNYATVAGDFNISLLQVNEREKLCWISGPDVYQQLCKRITLPTHIVKRPQILTDLTFCKLSFKNRTTFSASIVFSAIWDYCLCGVNCNILNSKQLSSKFFNTRKTSDRAIKEFLDDLL